MKLPQLFQALSAAVQRGDRPAALELGRQIQQQLASESAEHATLERQMRALLAELDGAPPPAASPAQPLEELIFDPLAERGGLDDQPEEASPSAEKETASSALTGDARLFPLWFGTNRRATADGKGFSGERDAQTTVGRVLVRVPEAHRFGETGSGFWQKLKRLDFRDDRLRLHEVQVQDEAGFYASLQAATQHDGATHALLFLHGFNVSFEEAAIRAAQLGCDLAVPGVTAFFSWPSRAAVACYPADEASIEASERAITDFLVDFATRSGAQKIHVIAHSMGNRGLLRALQRIAANAQTQGRVKFGQIFLAAPDVDRDLFLDLAHLYPAHSERTTLYASAADLPVHLSSKLHSAPRAGYFQPYTVAPEVDTVAVPDFDLDLLGHSYFAQAAALLHDMFDLMRLDAPPSSRQRLSAALEEDQRFWRLRL
ncbi:alpha/beta hydrolase [Paucibacter sp. DJ2R-2]|uniref:alpha/beta hydrolase n=1 Tax=Paucibacter sp. DJ2R-2 TaxID=2893558 RepID=UPI0021E45930|nr:alpha/beta hydrolase [Paucibacter sp. DJ2R-2]MCV2421604.1 alpha/beta hydrolase [Paucibacter sp. DJ4R-1]MCV2438309.1 alpha/beta hydrolase [Paucibacter sp. DJ2R-2]